MTVSIATIRLQVESTYDTEEDMSEDCLYLNIYTPCGQEDAQLPVLVWLHGDGLDGPQELRTGSGGTYFHGPEFLGTDFSHFVEFSPWEKVSNETFRWFQKIFL